VTKLAVKNGELPPGARDRVERDHQIEARSKAFLESVRLVFDDDAPAGPHFEYRPVSAISDLASMTSIVRLTGSIPPGTDHTAFAYGPHRCLGSHLARREMNIAHQEWARLIPTYRIRPGAHTSIKGIVGTFCLRQKYQAQIMEEMNAP